MKSLPLFTFLSSSDPKLKEDEGVEAKHVFAVTSGIVGWAYSAVDLGYYSCTLSSQLPGLIAGLE